jgi:hypothetical protein
MREQEAEIRAGSTIVRIVLRHGSMRMRDAGGEIHWDGWRSIDDVAAGIAEIYNCPADDARRAAEEAIRRWKSRSVR